MEIERRARETEIYKISSLPIRRNQTKSSITDPKWTTSRPYGFTLKPRMLHALILMQDKSFKRYVNVVSESILRRKDERNGGGYKNSSYLAQFCFENVKLVKSCKVGVCIKLCMFWFYIKWRWQILCLCTLYDDDCVTMTEGTHTSMNCTGPDQTSINSSSKSRRNSASRNSSDIYEFIHKKVKTSWLS